MGISDLLTSLGQHLLEPEFLISAVTVMELEHGWHRATTEGIRTERRRYLAELSAVIPVQPFDAEIARLAAGVDAALRKAGTVVATADLMIGSTALFYGYAIGTQNMRHFERIPGLSVVKI